MIFNGLCYFEFLEFRPYTPLPLLDPKFSKRFFSLFSPLFFSSLTPSFFLFSLSLSLVAVCHFVFFFPFFESRREQLHVSLFKTLGFLNPKVIFFIWIIYFFFQFKRKISEFLRIIKKKLVLMKYMIMMIMTTTTVRPWERQKCEVKCVPLDI